MIAVISVAVSFDWLVSPPPETVAVFVTEAGALLATFTMSVIDGYVAAAASASLRVQVSVASVQFQFVPLMAVADSPTGKASVTVTVPELEAPPLFFAVIV